MINLKKYANNSKRIEGDYLHPESGMTIEKGIIQNLQTIDVFEQQQNYIHKQQLLDNNNNN